MRASTSGGRIGLVTQWQPPASKAESTCSVSVRPVMNTTGMCAASGSAGGFRATNSRPWMSVMGRKDQFAANGSSHWLGMVAV
jgi:hypothetical protein